MNQLIRFTDLVSMFDKDTVIEVYTKGETEPWFANKAYLLQSIADKAYISVDMDKLKISSKFAGINTAHVVITTDEELSYVEYKKDWWDRLRLATPEEIKEEVIRVIKTFLFDRMETSCNEIAKVAMESGKCDKAFEEAANQIEYENILLHGFTKLDMINAKSNPTDSEFYNMIKTAIESTMGGDDGKAFQEILFG